MTDSRTNTQSEEDSEEPNQSPNVTSLRILQAEICRPGSPQKVES